METLNIINHDAVRVIEMDRPDALNAFSGLLMDDLTDAFIEAGTDTTVKVVVLTGAGRAFSSGADLKEMAGASYKAKHGLQVLLDTLIDFEKPFIVAVNGLGAGIGATICGLADLVFMSQDARLKCPFSSLGLTAEAASTQTFPRLMGRQQASWFLLSSEWMSADECKTAGLALEVLPSDKLMVHALGKAQTLAALPIASLIKTKSLMMAPIKQQLKDATRAENKALAELAGGPANREALKAFAEKREANFAGL